MARSSYGGWAGKILRVDLTSGKVEEQSTFDYVPMYVGARGIATRIAWDELKPGTTEFSPDNPLMFFTGPLTGTTAPCSGRVEVFGLGPQGYPVPWFTRSGMGGRWGPELKYAGYDGVVITGAAEKPVYLWIEDGKVQIRDASHLWGLGTYEAQRLIMDEHGRDVRIATIGQAGENLSRIAIVNSETESAAGQGGFGALMGSKKLKAIAVHGSGSIAAAHPEELLRKSLLVKNEVHSVFDLMLKEQPDFEEKFFPPGGKAWACSQQCARPCARYYRGIEGVVRQGRKYSGQLHCVGSAFPGMGKDHFYNWNLGFAAGFEVANFANDFGLNHWDLLLGIFPWLRDTANAGELKDVDGLTVDLNDPHFWAEVLRKIAYREGMGDALAEGGLRAQKRLGIGQEQIKPLYAAWGYAGHWDGHGDHCNYIVFPFWVVPAMQWAVDTRDPISSGHGYGQTIMFWSRFMFPKHGLDWEKMMGVAERLYGPGNARAMDPLGGYEAKASAAVWHTLRSAAKDSLPIDDQMFPRLFSIKTEDAFPRAGEMDGPSFEYHMFKEATGVDWSEEELSQACERIINLDRGLQIRDHGRTRKDDEGLIPYLEREEDHVNPLIGEKQRLDGDRFRGLMTEFYKLRGWDPETGWPTRAKLDELGLPEVAAMVAEKDSAGGIG
jgi:aldehyde:ferredoxin oxidoreductase